MKIKICPVCGKEFETTSGTRLYCSYACGERAKELRKQSRGVREAKCVICGKTFLTESATAKVCSDECRAEHKRRLARAYKASRRPKKKKQTLRQVVREADEHGMSYGMWVALGREK